MSGADAVGKVKRTHLQHRCPQLLALTQIRVEDALGHCERARTASWEFNDPISFRREIPRFYFPSAIMPLTLESASAALGTVLDPELQRSLNDVGMVRDLSIDGDSAELTVDLISPSASYKDTLDAAINAALREAGAKRVKISFSMAIPTRNILSDDPFPGVKNIVLVMSG